MMSRREKAGNQLLMSLFRMMSESLRSEVVLQFSFFSFTGSWEE